MERPFRPDELPDDVASGEERAAALEMARELERLASTSGYRPDGAFGDRVMAAVAREPVPQPVIATRRALRELRPRALLASLGDAWRVALGGGRPLGVRAQAVALVLVAAVALVSIGGIATVGALDLLERPGPPPVQPVSPEPSVAPYPSVAPSPSPSPSQSPPDESSASPDATETIEPGEAESATRHPTESPEDRTARPTRTPEPDKTEDPDHTDDPEHAEEPDHTESPEHT